jgi:cyclohexanone monooxygenase
VNWATDTLKILHDNGITRIAATREAEDEWVEHELSFIKGRENIAKQASWFNGGNIPGKTLFPAYNNTLPAYRAILESVARDGYAGFDLSRGTTPIGAEPEATSAMAG